MQNLTSEKLLTLTDQGFDIYRKLIGPDLKLGKTILSPLRVERSPSFSLYVHRTRGDIWYKDFPESGENFHGDAFNFIKVKYNLTSFRDVIKVVKQEVLNIYDDDPISIQELERKRYTPKMVQRERPQFIPERRDWTEKDMKFWHRFMIHKGVLEKFHVYPVSSYKKVTGDIEKIYHEYPNDPIYFIQFPSGSVKVYRPLTSFKGVKWASNTEATRDIFGLDLITEPVDDLFILAGNKDVMSFHATTGLPAIALAAEGTNITMEMELVFTKLAKRVHILYDNDDTGMKMAKKIYLNQRFPYYNHLLSEFLVNDYAELVDKKREHLCNFLKMLKVSMSLNYSEQKI